MSEYTLVNLGDLGTKYIRECLANGQSSSKYFLANHKFDGGPFTLIPDNIPVNARSRLKEGILPLAQGGKRFMTTAGNQRLSYAAVEMEPHLFLRQVILDYCKLGPNYSVIFEAPFYNPAAPMHRNNKPGLIRIGKEQWVTLRDTTSILKSEGLLLAAGSPWPPPIGFLCNLDTKELSRSTQDFNRKLALSTEILVVGAYDGEGYVFATISTDRLALLKTALLRMT